MPLLPRYHLTHWANWVSEPHVTTRGTWDILQSCLVTIFFCTATSLHLNIPTDRNGTWRRRGRRLAWMTVTTFAPEVFMCIAKTQYLEARIVQKKIKSYCRNYHKSDTEWTMVQALYYNMGGYVFRSRHQRSCFHGKPKQPRIKHLKYIVQAGLLGQLDRDTETINEFSKSDRLSKTIAIVQALWLLIQTFARYVEHLPSSPLEVTALAYISCTFFSFMIWLRNPQDVGFSTEVDDDAFEQLIRDACERRKRSKQQHHHVHSHSDSQRNFHHGSADISEKKRKGWKHHLPNVGRKYPNPISLSLVLPGASPRLFSEVYT